uniref:tRNA(Ile)-lysidine synthase, chloroplastic n=1 Tax=Streptosarcina moshanensis TaxID=3096259 RepID=A0AAU7LLH9_9VIRI
MYTFSLAWRVNNDLVHRRLVNPGESVLVAVSGGQDSSCLLSLLMLLQPTWGWDVSIVHCDHEWSVGSRLIASHVSQWSSVLSLDYHQCFPSTSLEGENKSREWRYRALDTVARSQGCTTIFLAHTSGDRVETLLYHMLRGSGIQGLQSLSWKRPISKQITLVRPLLAIRRRDTSKACTSTYIPTWPDLSNQLVGPHRNRIRKRLIPYLRHYFNPKIDQSLSQLAELLHSEESYMQGVCLAVLRCTSNTYEKDQAIVNTIVSLPIAIQRRVLRLLLVQRGTKASFAHVESLRIRVSALCLCRPASTDCVLSAVNHKVLVR